MTIRIKCSTLFDITQTGIKNRFHKSRLPFQDDAGRAITNDQEWQRSRNQQNNWETVNQVISLRTLPEKISNSQHVDNRWEFEFDVVDPDSIFKDGNPVAALLEDCKDVPMILGLEESESIDPMLIPGKNIWFDLVGNQAK